MSRRFIGAEIGVVQNLKIEKLVLGLAFVFGLGNWLRERGFFLFLLRILGVLGGLWRSVGLVVVGLLVFIVFQHTGQLGRMCPILPQ
jgi:hypothetical protein